MAKENEDFYDIFKRFAKKTETLIDTQVDKLKGNGTIDQIEGYINKTGDYVEKKNPLPQIRIYLLYNPVSPLSKSGIKLSTTSGFSLAMFLVSLGSAL